MLSCREAQNKFTFKTTDVQSPLTGYFVRVAWVNDRQIIIQQMSGVPPKILSVVITLLFSPFLLLQVYSALTHAVLDHYCYYYAHARLLKNGMTHLKSKLRERKKKKNTPSAMIYATGFSERRDMPDSIREPSKREKKMVGKQKHGWESKQGLVERRNPLTLATRTTASLLVPNNRVRLLKLVLLTSAAFLPVSFWRSAQSGKWDCPVWPGLLYNNNNDDDETDWVKH